MNSRRLFTTIYQCIRITPRILSRPYSLAPKDELIQMQQDYTSMCRRCEELALELEQVNPRAVFVNNEVIMSKLRILGFDYDHTLATYTLALNEFIFSEARNWLVRQMKYPEPMLEMNFDPEFVIRGLHFDLLHGYMMKVDSYHSIQLDTVHLGLSPVSPDKTIEAYRGTYLPSTSLKRQLSGSNLGWSKNKQSPMLFQLMDFFTLPEFYLICSIIEFFEREGINYQPLHVYQDVSSSVSRIHKSGLLGLNIMGNPAMYIHPDPELGPFLKNLVLNGRKLFLISNSSAAFIDRGMRFMIGDEWRDLFDVIITRAHKPRFFHEELNPFRHMDECGTFKDWVGVQSLNRGHIYEGGCIGELIRLTNWNAENILYFGDHVYSDLADLSNLQGWTTAAVIPELEREIQVTNSEKVRSCSIRLRFLEGLINRHQHVIASDAKQLLHAWLTERKELRLLSKAAFNNHFGSIFRSFHNPSYFSRRLNQYAVLYTSKLTNLGNYPLDHVFFPKRTALPHEII